MQKVPLFLTKKERFLTLFVGLVLLCLSFGYEFYKFKNILAYSIYKDTFRVINTYQKVSKKGKTYTVLKLKNKNLTLNGIYWEPLHVEKFDEVEAIFYTKNLTFKKYLQGFYAPLKSLHVVNRYKKNKFLLYIENQHKSLRAKELYGALFFGLPLSKELREDIAKWGISHLVAISGFHFGIIGAVLFFLLKPIYSFFQDKFFPYRNRGADLAFLVLFLLGIYGYILNFSPSVLRAFVMSVLGYFMFVKHIRVISFSTLFITAFTILILYPKLLFSIAFWFSLSGVFYLFLFLYHFSHISKVMQFVAINFWVFFCMLPIVHFVFDTFSPYQFLSPIISMIFIFFYPLSLMLHVASFGGIFDELILKFLSLHVEIFSIKTTTSFLSIYLLISLFAIRYKSLAYTLPLFFLYVFI